jgi:hypothetical protein
MNCVAILMRPALPIWRLFANRGQAEIIDDLIDLLILTFRRIETTATKRIGKQVVDEARDNVDNKPRLLKHPWTARRRPFARESIPL